MIEIKAPEIQPWVQSPITIFLVGSIEMGVAEPWQEKIVEALEGYNVIILNPRRTDWDSSWVQSINNPEFFEQVNWEFTGIQESDIIFVYFDPNTKSPITLFELGYCLGSGKEPVIVCPKGYFRKGNVDIYANRFDLRVNETLEHGLEELRRILDIERLVRGSNAEN